MSDRRYKFDRGDWIAVTADVPGGYRLVGKVVDADSESITVRQRDGTRTHFVVGEDSLARAKWRGRRWFV